MNNIWLFRAVAQPGETEVCLIKFFHTPQGVMNFGRSSTRDHCSYALPMGAFTTTDCRAAFISTGAGSIVCAELSGGESSILLPRKNPALSVGEVKERHVKHEHRVVNFWSTPKNLPRGGMATKCLGLSTSVN